MTIVFYDGGQMTASEVEVLEKELLVDGYRIAPLIEVQRIID